MSEHASDPASDEARNLPVLAPAPDARPIERPDQMQLTTPVAAATGGFLAGVGAFVLMRALRGGARRGLPLRRRKRNALEIAGSRSFLVDVHVLKR